MLSVYGGATVAINYAKRRMADFNEHTMKPSEYDPGTTVYKLVQELMKYLED